MTVAQRFYLVGVSVTGTVLLLCGLGSAIAPPAAIAASAVAPLADVASVQARYDKLCKSCHGVDGRGVAAKAATLKIEPEKLNLGRAEVKDVSRDDQRKFLLEGKEKMPAYAKKLKPEEVDPLLDLAMALGEKIRSESP